MALVADKTVSEGSTNRTVSEGTNKTVSGGSRREVKVYVCDGEPQGDAEWFAGQTTSNMLDLTSVSGKARLQAQLTEKEVAGTITLTDGSSHRFSALAARNGAGLYEVTIGPNGQRSGTSANGAKNKDTISSDGVLTTGTIKLPSGEAIDYRMIAIAGYEGGFKPDTYTSIVLPGAAKKRGRGGNVKKNTPPNNFISNELNLQGLNSQREMPQLYCSCGFEIVITGRQTPIPAVAAKVVASSGLTY